MKQILTATLIFAAIGAKSLSAAQSIARAEGTDQTVRLKKSDSRLLLHVADTAAAWGWEVKIIAPGKLLTLCSSGLGGVCIPLKLDQLHLSGKGKDLYLAAAALENALSFRTVETDGQYLLKKEKLKTDPAAEIPAYNAAWGKGRGFRPGQTLPDIPLYDMQGAEVRFSKFLGKQYILYCWASW